ncbi:Aspartic protease [Lecanosticta acicola]|uniref:Aspartic protease n=1 Tax=Lecanosticta acicola TaxID=111012 RepID=A0AAI8Z1E4_9PEZI|nr:Aspartic protease [Lecanosticta acicola]
MKSAIILSLGALALAAPKPESQPKKISYSRKQHETRADGDIDYTPFFTAIRTAVRKYNSQKELPAAIEKAGLQKRTSNEPLTDDVEDGTVDELYYGAGQVSGQTFTFDFDTGSSDTFVPGPQCGTAQGCSGSTKYDQSGTDEHNTTTITYGSGMVMGENYYDDVTIAGLTATHQNIISLTNAQGFSGTGADSLMGMGFESIAQSKQPPYWMTLLNEGNLSPSEFSFYLGREKSNTQSKSEMTLAGRDSSRYTGSFTNVPVTQQGYWQVAIDGMSVGNGAAVAGSAGQAAIDTGTTLILAPTAAVASLITQIPGAVPLPLGEDMTAIAYPCSSTPQVNLGFAGKKFAINKLDFQFLPVSAALGVQMDSDPLTSVLDQLLDGLLGGAGGGLPANYCLASVIGGDLDPTENLYVVGDAFLKNWYSTFHYDSPSSAYVAFAKSV